MSNLSNNPRIVVARHQVACDLGGNAAVLNLNDGIYYGLNPISTRIWNLIQEPKTLKEINDTILAEYDVDRSRCEADVLTLMTQLVGQGLIEILT